VGIKITGINQPVAFIRESDAVFSEDCWTAIVNFDLSPYDSAVSTLTYHLHEIRNIEETTASSGELSNLEGVLQNIEGKLNNIKRFLPRKVKKRGLFDIGGSALQYLFGVATQIDLRTLHDTVQELHSRQHTVAHSVQQQLVILSS
jgi:hypothetical protein